MKKYLCSFFFAAFSALLMLCGCQPKQEMLLIPIQDDVFLFPSEIFTGASVQKLAELEPAGVCTAALNSFLLKKDGKNILFDAGAGSETSQLMNVLSSLGIKPKDIDAVFITHCHYDHIGGLTKISIEDGDTSVVAAFPKAVVYISSKEYNAWAEDQDLKGKNLTFVNMEKAYGKRIVQFEYEVPVYCGIIGHDAKGHTPGHTVYEFGNTMIFGDLLHAKEYQLVDPDICAFFDKDMENAVKNRIYYYDYAAKNHKRVAAMHLPDGGIIEDFATVWTPAN